MAALLSQFNTVVAIDTDMDKVNSINNRISPIEDKDIQNFFDNKKLDLYASSKINACKDSEYIVIAVPTDYDEDIEFFNTGILDKVLADVSLLNPDAAIIIKSTVPIGYTENAKILFSNNNIFFSPEFLREGSALYDNLHPSRIVIGSNSEMAKKFSDLLVESAEKRDIAVIFAESREAESIKLFANTYLAMRISFFNELDSFCIENNLDAYSIVKGISLDERVGDYYNNPSFGYGGYCLPKDTKQLLSNFKKTPQDIISAIVYSNKTRKEFIVKKIIDMNITNIGIYKLAMKTNSDNPRFSAIQDIMNNLKSQGLNITIYDPSIKDSFFEGFPVIEDLDFFKNSSELILANRYNDEIKDVSNKVFSRDLFGNN